MNNRHLFLALIFGLFLFLPGCEVIAGIFKAGFWTAIILIVLIVALAVYGYRKLSGRP